MYENVITPFDKYKNIIIIKAFTIIILKNVKYNILTENYTIPMHLKSYFTYVFYTRENAIRIFNKKSTNFYKVDNNIINILSSEKYDEEYFTLLIEMIKEKYKPLKNSNLFE